MARCMLRDLHLQMRGASQRYAMIPPMPQLGGVEPDCYCSRQACQRTELTAWQDVTTQSGPLQGPRGVHCKDPDAETWPFIDLLSSCMIQSFLLFMQT